MGNKITDRAIDLLDKTFLSGTLFMLDKLLNTLAKAAPEFKKELEAQDIAVQIKTRDNSGGRLLHFRHGEVTGKKRRV